MIRNLLALARDILLGPRCPHGCGHRARDWRTLSGHCWTDHAGDPVPPYCRCRPAAWWLGSKAPTERSPR